MISIKQSIMTISMVYMTAFGVNASEFNKEEFACLAKNVYFEARGESELGQRAVAWVTLNRVGKEGFPSTICGVVHHEDQFVWVRDQKSNTPKDIMAWADAIIVAKKVYDEFNSGGFDPTEGAVMFHGAHIEPYWSVSFERTTRIDNHIFYKES